jgi:hypothetical protein
MIDLALSVLLSTSQPQNNKLPPGWEIPCAVGFGLGVLFSRTQPQQRNSQVFNSDLNNNSELKLDDNYIDSQPGELDLEPFINIGRDIIKGFAISDRSQMIVAPSRCGKTTILYLMLEEFFKRFPNMECYCWQGKAIQCIHPKIPRENHVLFEANDNIDFTTLNKVWEIYQARSRGSLDRTPIKLIITDWQSIKDGINSVNPKSFKTIAAKIMTIANNGAELKITVAADSQSANIEDWGLGSGSLRDNFDIYAVARIEYVDGYEKGDIKALPKLIGNTDIVVSTKDRDELLKSFELLKKELGKTITSSLLLSTVGSCKIGITPTFEREKLTWFSKIPKRDFETAKQREISDSSDSPKRHETPETTAQDGFELELGNTDDFVSESTFTPLKLPKTEALETITKLRNAKYTQTQIIKLLWRASPGDNEPYKNAIDEYKELTR